MIPRPNNGKFFLLVVIVFLFDIITKALVRNNLDAPVNVIGNFLTLTFVKNFGAGFSILQGQRIFLILAALGASGYILYSYKDYEKEPLVYYSLALILAGALGNVVDRIVLGYVVDFIRFSFWPAFNIADSAISIGATGLIFSALKTWTRTLRTR